MSDHDERQNSPPPGDDHDHNGAMVDEGEPDVRFDIADVPRQMAAEDSHQQEDVQRALYQNNENNRDHVRKFNATRRKDVKFSRLRELLATGQHRTAMALLRCRRRLVVDDEYLVAKDDPNVVARVGPHYIDYALYVGARCGLDAVLPNFRTDHNWSAKLDLTMTNRLWPDANIKGLPFNPSGRMVYIGTRLDEQIWLAMVPNTYFLPDHLDNVPEHHPSLPAKTTSLTPGHQLMLIMFLAYILAREMHHEDIHVAHQYPNPLTRAAVAASTEILGREGEQHRRINLRPHDLHRLHDAITRCYVQWVRDAPREWKEDGFLTNNSPVGVTIRYGQNQPIGSTRTRNEEQENWHRDRNWMHMRRFTFSLATHISMLVVTEWTEISVEDILDAHENLYDKPEDHPDRRRVDLHELRLLDDDGFEIPVFNEQGFRVGRRAPREYDTCGALLDLERVHELFQGPEDVHGRAQNVGSYMMYPMAFTRTMGNVQAHSLFPVFQQRVSLIDEVVRPPVLDEDVAMDDEDDNNEVLRRGAPVLKGTGCQVYNSLSHRVRSETKFHLVQLGKITSALAGSTASTVAGKRNWTRCVNGCKNGLPHQMFAEKVSGPGQPQTMRFENTYTLDVSRMVEDLRDGGWIYGHVICPLLKAWSHQTVLAPVKDALVVFEPDIVPELFKAATYPICAMLQMLWDENVDGLTQGNVVNPCLIEFVSMLERTLNFGHTGNARVLTRGLMDRSWLSLALLHDGFPSLSEAFVAHGSLFSGSLVIRQDAWPVDAQTRRPLTSSARSQELTYGEQHYEAYLARFTIRLAMQRMSEDVYPTIPDASVKFACYAAEIALRIYMDDVKRLVNAQVSEELAPLFDSNDRHVRRSAVERQRALECWLDEDFPLSYERGVLGNLMAATTEPQGGSYSLTEANIGRKSISFLVDILLKHVQGTPRRREPPFITKGHFLPVLKIAVEEMHHIAALNHSYASKVDQFIADAITHVFEVLKINHVPWSSNPLPGARNRASSVVTSKVWLGLGGKEPPRAGQGSSLIARQHSSLSCPHRVQHNITAKMHAIQQQYWAVRDYLSPVLKESKFKEHGRITPEEFVAAGDFLAYKFPVWTWEKGDASKAREYLPAEKQYLVTRGVPCLRRATSLAYTDADEDAERLLSFGDSSGADEWVETHAGRKLTAASATNPGEIDDIPDLDGDHELASAIGNVSISSTTGATASETPDLDDIPDMEEEDLEEGEDEATAAPKVGVPSSGPILDASQIEVAGGNLLQVRTYDVMITYDKYYQTPRIWLIGYDENRTPLTPSQIFQDVSADHALKTVTIEAFPHSATLQAASVHPCKHASVMKKVIERMNAGVVEEQLAARKKEGKENKESKKKWGFGRKAGKDDKGAADDEEVEGMRVDFYLVVFLKFIASIVPTIEVDSTTAF